MWYRYQRRSVSRFFSSGMIQLRGKGFLCETSRCKLIMCHCNSAKRYERMMKAHGIHTPSASIRDTPVPTRRSRTEDKTGDNKKRKFNEFNTDASNLATDDDEGLSNVKEEHKNVAIKDEEQLETQLYTHGDYIPYTNLAASNGAGFDETSLFDEFIHSTALNQHPVQPQGYGSQYISTEQSSIDPTGQKYRPTALDGIHESILITD